MRTTTARRPKNGPTARIGWMTMVNDNLDNIVLALLFSAEEPLSIRKIVAVLGEGSANEVAESVERWRKRFDDESWSVALEKVAGGYQLSSRPEYASYIARLYSGRRKVRLSKAALETLAIIAYKQPITRADIENIRGVGCGSVISNLLERALVRITGKAKVLGAPFLYGTTREFLSYLGLNSLRDLPSVEELEALLEREETAVAGEEGDAGVGAGAPADDGRESDDAEGVQTDGEAAEAMRAGAGSARRGPNVEEPHHRPLGEPDEDRDGSQEPPLLADDGNHPQRREKSAEAPDETGAEEDIRNDPET
jgi:segregation and condensation protein B